MCKQKGKLNPVLNSIVFLLPVNLFVLNLLLFFKRISMIPRKFPSCFWGYSLLIKERFPEYLLSFRGGGNPSPLC